MPGSDVLHFSLAAALDELADAEGLEVRLDSTDPAGSEEPLRQAIVLYGFLIDPSGRSFGHSLGERCWAIVSAVLDPSEAAPSNRPS